MNDTLNICNIGIVAHVDAGKTTTTEHMLYCSGRIRTLGRVDDGTSHTDWLAVERSRGISVRAAVTRLEWRAHTLNLIDTPGHVDFSAEVERSLRVLDAAILVISAVDGVQAHTETLWHALQSLKLPTFIYVNKVDRLGIDPTSLLEDLRTTLHPAITPIQMVDSFGPDFSRVTSIWQSPTPTEPDPVAPLLLEELHALLAEHDESLLTSYIDGTQPESSALKRIFTEQFQAAQVYPVLYGASLKGLGVPELLDTLTDYSPAPAPMADAPLSGLVFNVQRDKAHGRLAYVRLFAGTLRNRDHVYNATRDVDEKITQIRRVDAGTYTDTGILTAGDVAAVYGLSHSRIGDALGVASATEHVRALSVPLLTVQVIPQLEQDYIRLAEALQELYAEDPDLDLQWLPTERELHIRIMGTIQLEVLQQMIAERFGLAVTFSPPTVVYQETPAQPAQGFVAYTMPKPCWAILRFQIEPGPLGSGLVYHTQVRTEDLLMSYQNEVARRVPEALLQGMYGWEVTDLQVTLIEGQHHVWHTHPLDFVVATPMAIMDGLQRAGTRLLEPILHFRISVPEEFGGRVLSDLSLMRAEFATPSILRGRLLTDGIIPLATSLAYPLHLGILTGGRGILTTRFFEYRLCPPDIQATHTRRGVNPLDTARWILAARSALSSGV